jgi:hypothetical protein
MLDTILPRSPGAQCAIKNATRYRESQVTQRVWDHECRKVSRRATWRDCTKVARRTAPYLAPKSALVQGVTIPGCSPILDVDYGQTEPTSGSSSTLATALLLEQGKACRSTLRPESLRHSRSLEVLMSVRFASQIAERIEAEERSRKKEIEAAISVERQLLSDLLGMLNEVEKRYAMTFVIADEGAKPILVGSVGVTSFPAVCWWIEGNVFIGKMPDRVVLRREASSMGAFEETVTFLVRAIGT